MLTLLSYFASMLPKGGFQAGSRGTGPESLLQAIPAPCSAKGTLQSLGRHPLPEEMEFMKNAVCRAQLLP